METGFKKGFGDFKVSRVWCGNSNKIDAVFPSTFASQHFLPVAIGPVIRDTQPFCEIYSSLRVVIQGTGNHFELAIQSRTYAMRWSNLAPLAAANHTPFQL